MNSGCAPSGWLISNQHSSFNTQHSTLNIHHSTFNTQHSTLNIHQPSSLSIPLYRAGVAALFVVFQGIGQCAGSGSHSDVV